MDIKSKALDFANWLIFILRSSFSSISCALVLNLSIEIDVTPEKVRKTPVKIRAMETRSGRINMERISFATGKVTNIPNDIKTIPDGVDLDCFNILNLIYRIIGPLGIRFNQQMYLDPNSERLARVTVSFKKEDYDDLNSKMKEFCE